ncbi:14127_t:CDS:1, partial [Entrophospora sp. SA101]
INGFVKEIIKYGIEIIHCDFKRLVFSTKTNNADEAARCLQHVLALLKKDEFKYLVIRASETYSALRWLNGDNYVGIKGANEDNEADYDLNYVIRLQMVEKVNYIEDITKEHIKEFLRDFIFWCRDDKISPGELMTNTGNKVNSFIGILKKKSATLYISIVCTLLEMVVGKERSQQLKSLLCIMQGMSVYSDDVKNLSSKESHDVIGYACECGQVDNYHINNFECSYCNEDITNNKDFELFLIHYLNIQLDESSMTKGEEIIEKLQKFHKYCTFGLDKSLFVLEVQYNMLALEMIQANTINLEFDSHNPNLCFMNIRVILKTPLIHIKKSNSKYCGSCQSTR